MNEEYKMLREEIVSNMKQIHQYFALTNTAIFLILAYIFGNPNNPNIFVAVFAILVCISDSVRVKRLMEGNVSISTYMEIFLEPNLEGRSWETNNHYRIGGYNSHEINKRSAFVDTLFFRANSPYLLLSVIMYFLYFIVLVQNLSFFNIFASGIFNTVAFFIIQHNARFDANNVGRDEYINYWKKVKMQDKGVPD